MSYNKVTRVATLVNEFLNDSKNFGKCHESIVRAKITRR